MSGCAHSLFIESFSCTWNILPFGDKSCVGIPSTHRSLFLLRYFWKYIKHLESTIFTLLFLLTVCLSQKLWNFHTVSWFMTAGSNKLIKAIINGWSEWDWRSRLVYNNRVVVLENPILAISLNLLWPSNSQRPFGKFPLFWPLSSHDNKNIVIVT